MASHSGSLLSGQIPYAWKEWAFTNLNVALAPDIPEGGRGLWFMFCGYNITRATSVSIGGLALSHILNLEKFGRYLQLWHRSDITARANDTISCGGSTSGVAAAALCVAAGSPVGWVDTDGDSGWSAWSSRSYTQNAVSPTTSYQLGLFVSGGEATVPHGWTLNGGEDRIKLGHGAQGGGYTAGLVAREPTATNLVYGATGASDARFSGGQMMTFTDLYVAGSSRKRPQSIVVM